MTVITQGVGFVVASSGSGYSSRVGRARRVRCLFQADIGDGTRLAGPSATSPISWDRFSTCRHRNLVSNLSTILCQRRKGYGNIPGTLVESFQTSSSSAEDFGACDNRSMKSFWALSFTSRSLHSGLSLSNAQVSIIRPAPPLTTTLALGLGPVLALAFEHPYFQYMHTPPAWVMPG